MCFGVQFYINFYTHGALTDNSASLKYCESQYGALHTVCKKKIHSHIFMVEKVCTDTEKERNGEKRAFAYEWYF